MGKDKHETIHKRDKTNIEQDKQRSNMGQDKYETIQT